MKKIKNDIEFEDVLNSSFSIFLGKTKNCGVCNVIQKRLEEVIPSDIEFYYGFMEDLSLTRGKYLIFSSPTIIIFEEGKEIFREAGFVKIENILNKVEEYKKTRQ